MTHYDGMHYTVQQELIEGVNRWTYSLLENRPEGIEEIESQDWYETEGTAGMFARSHIDRLHDFPL